LVRPKLPLIAPPAVISEEISQVWALVGEILLEMRGVTPLPLLIPPPRIDGVLPVMENPIAPRDGFIQAPEGPGFGMQIKPEAWNHAAAVRQVSGR